MQVKKQQLEPDLGKQTGSKLGKEYVKAICCHPVLTYIQSTSYKMPGWMKHKLESRLLGEISITSDMQMTPPLWQKAAAKSLQSGLTLCDPIDGSPPDSAVPGIFQARTLEWVAMGFSRQEYWSGVPLPSHY